MSGLSDWLLEFRQLHQGALRGELGGSQLALYRTGRDELARALIAAQRLQLKGGEVPRRVLRVARALQVDIDVLVSQRAVTIDLSTGGFSCLLAKAPPIGEEAQVTLRMPGAEPLVARARVQGVKQQQGNVRVSFEFVGLSEASTERLELLVFDTVLSQLTPA